ncbi:hypothetical protein CASFOL_033271 [Castilleja foliolosa]|uniref:Uncharacterized protein n=1 Tax=Castilleja foliolosa TaxID=1961234 RepID=A0ABD3C032_9LAMI
MPDQPGRETTLEVIRLCLHDSYGQAKDGLCYWGLHIGFSKDENQL